jgi:hypothetical protein
MYPTFPSPKFKNITASANPVSYGDETNICFRGLNVSGAGNVTVTNDIGDSVIIPFADNQFLPVVSRYMTAYSGAGTVTALF